MRRFVFLIAVLAAAPPAGAAELSATVEPDTVVFPVTRELTYSLHVRTGADAERLSVWLVEPLFDPDGIGFEEGAALRRGSVRHEGAGEFFVSGVVETGVLQCSRAHGHGFAGDLYELRMPPNSEATVVATESPPLLPPWPATDLALTFRVHAGGGAEPQFIRSPSPRFQGPRGIELHARLRTGGRSAIQAPPPVLTAAPNELVNVSGSADPLPSRVAVRIRPGGAGRPVSTIARPRLRPSGGFFARIRAPRKAGMYQVYAAAPGDSARGLVGDASCARLLEVR